MLVKWRLFYPGLKEGGFLDMELRMNEAARDVARGHGAVLADPDLGTSPILFISQMQARKGWPRCWLKN
jgi:hypothetical protein